MAESSSSPPPPPSSSTITVDWKPSSSITSSTRTTSLLFRISILVFAILVLAGGITIGILRPWMVNNDGKVIFTPSADTVHVQAHVSSELVNVLRNASGQLTFPYLIPQSGLDALFDWDAVFLGIGISSHFPEASRFFAGSMLNFLKNVSLSTGEVRGLLFTNGGSSYLSHAKPVLIYGAYLAAQLNGNDFNSFRPYSSQMSALLKYWDQPPRFDSTSGCSLWIDMPESGADNLAYQPCASDAMPCWNPNSSAYSVATPDLPVFRERQALAFELFTRHWADSDAKIARDLELIAQEANIAAVKAKVEAEEVARRKPSLLDTDSTSTATAYDNSHIMMTTTAIAIANENAIVLANAAKVANEKANAALRIATTSAKDASDASLHTRTIRADVNRCLNSLWSDTVGGWTAKNMSTGLLLSTRTYMLAWPLWGSKDRIETPAHITSAIDSIFKPDMVASDSRLIRSLSSLDPLYTNLISVPGMTGSNWRGPAWMPPNILLAYSLAANGQKDAALLLAQAILRTLAGDLERTGTWHENYNTDNITSVMGDAGFLSFNALAVDLEQNLVQGVDPFELRY